ncbi:hypothetical protein Q1695_006832 [Nippostrongylus brasiliensis]|nr:hypothetical protein Q1695_006832 [Nippostrongylus brasiliensis]
MLDVRLAMTVVLGVLSAVAVIANLLLFVIITVNTPKAIRTYSVLIVNYVLTDLFTTIAQAITMARLVAANHSFSLMFYGICTKVSSSFCFSTFLAETFGLSHGLNSVLLSIAYRYFSLRYGVPKRRPIIILCFVACLPSLVPVGILWRKWSSEQSIRETIRTYRPDVFYPEMTVAGIDDSSDSLMQAVFAFYLVLWFPVIITINILKRKMYAMVRSHANHLSTETLRLHTNLIQALTTQSLVPFLHMMTYVCFIVDQYIYANDFVEIVIFLPIVLVSIATPMINIYYIRPYRETFKTCFRNRGNKQGEIRSSLPRM